MKRVILLGSSITLIVILIFTIAIINKKKISEHHLEVMLRDIGHQLLLSAKDSTSRVLPIKQLGENTYQISFQNNFSFISDSLMAIVEREFQKNALANEYIVNVRNCQQKETLLAFEMNNKTGNLTPCKGRKLEGGCYIVEIDLLKPNTFNYLWLLLLTIPLSVVGFAVKNKSRKKEAPTPVAENDDFIPLSNFRFYPNDCVLKLEDKCIMLTDKETKALKIFAENINQIVEREKLMKAIWEEEGIVVISRNVDVLVSKLRKKLSDDDSIKFTNVHGKGYKFIIE